MFDPYIFLAPVLLLPVVALLRFIGCSSFDAASDPVVYKVTVLSSDNGPLGPGKTRQFTATVTGGANTSVIWSANAPNGLYTAPSPYVPGSPPVTITATSAADSTAAGSAIVTLGPASPVIRVNCGGAVVPDAPLPWSADTGFTSGTAFTKTAPNTIVNALTNLAASPIYDTCRFGNFSYAFTVPAPGTYFVTLKFAELSPSADGRTFGFTIVSGGASQGRNPYNISTEAGGDFRTKDETYVVAVDVSRTITIQFTPGPAITPQANLALINAIEIAQ